MTEVAGTMGAASMSVSSDTVSATGVTYTFDATAVNPIPTDGALWIDYSGATATFTSSGTCAGDLTFYLNSEISTAGCTVDTSTASIIKYTELWTDTDTTGRIFFELPGWTNPATDVA